MTVKAESNARYISGALIIHALIAGVFIAASLYSPHVVIPELGIKAALVDSNTLNPPKKAEPESDVAEQQRQEEQKKQEKQEKQEQLELERQKEKDREKEQQKEEQLRVEQQEKEKLAEQKRVADVQQEAKRQKQEADKKRVEEIKQKQHDLEAKRKQDADAKAQAAREAELKAQLADEEGRNQAVNTGVLARWQAEVMAKIRMKWKQPPTAKGTDCDVAVVQSPNGNVIRAQVTRCNGDVAVRQSIETAVLDASPLPLPSDMHVFTRSFTVRFHPEE